MTFSGHIASPARTFLCGTLVWLALLAPSASAQGANVSSVGPRSTITFQLSRDALLSSSIEVARGIAVRREDWPTLVIATVRETPEGPEYCTGTLVGPRTILTAAHCLDAGDGIRAAELLVTIPTVSLKCEVHKDYLASPFVEGGVRNSFDYALCYIQSGRKFSALSGVRFDVIDGARRLSPAAPVLLTGFGCDRLSLTGIGGLSWTQAIGKLTIGDALVGSPTDTWSDEPNYFTVRSNPARDPSVCPGDSGGPLFSGITATAPSASPRRIRGVNSRVCTQVRGVTSEACARGRFRADWEVISSIAATGSESFTSWALAWSASHDGAVICGITREAGVSPCRP